MYLCVSPNLKLYTNCTIVCLSKRTIKHICFKKHFNSKLKVPRNKHWVFFNMSYLSLKYMLHKSSSEIFKDCNLEITDINSFHLKSAHDKVNKKMKCQVSDHCYHLCKNFFQLVVAFLMLLIKLYTLSSARNC